MEQSLAQEEAGKKALGHLKERPAVFSSQGAIQDVLWGSQSLPLAKIRWCRGLEDPPCLFRASAVVLAASHGTARKPLAWARRR